MPFKLLLTNHQSPGDILMLTAAVRNLHLRSPKQYLVAVDTSCPQLWENNPYVVSPQELGEPHLSLRCAYPLIHQSNQRPYHFIHGFTQHLAWRLGIDIPVKSFAGDIHLSSDERISPPPFGTAAPPERFWIIMAGGKYDLTAKWWDPAAFQSIVDHFQGGIRFVQCGQADHWHPALRGVMSCVGQTTHRQFIQLMYHADGVVCPVTFAMHLAAAVPLRPGQLNRAAVVIAGGREPPHWEAYPGHQFFHTQGMLPCCARGGCWKSRCQPVGDGDSKDEDLCVAPVEVSSGLRIPKCMAMISPQAVIRGIEAYFEGGICNYLPGTAA